MKKSACISSRWHLLLCAGCARSVHRGTFNSWDPSKTPMSKNTSTRSSKIRSGPWDPPAVSIGGISFPQPATGLSQLKLRVARLQRLGAARQRISALDTIVDFQLLQKNVIRPVSHSSRAWSAASQSRFCGGRILSTRRACRLSWGYMHDSSWNSPRPS